MSDLWTKRWDDRYAADAYAYGIEPNEYLRKQLQPLEPGRILFPAEGEGRNAVYAAKLGWDVAAIDISEEGRKKAVQLAEKEQVTIDYKVGEMDSLNFNQAEFDAIALIYAHFPAEIKSEYHHRLHQYLRKDGLVIFEAFSKKHLEYVLRDEKIGGPRDLGSLFSIEEIAQDFKNFEVIELEELDVELNEGLFHNGTGSVIRFVGKKK